MYKGRITKVDRPILNVYMNFREIFSQQEKKLIEKYLKTIVAPIKRVVEVDVKRESNGLIIIRDITNNQEITTIYFTELKVLLDEH